jgi:hypothetical protein
VKAATIHNSDFVNRMQPTQKLTIVNAKFKEHKYFVDEVETQLREKLLRGS